jgi:hypothetical protein
LGSKAAAKIGLLAAARGGVHFQPDKRPDAEMPAMTSLLLTLLVCAPGGADVDTIVVCPQEFRETLAPWVAHRRRQGHRVAVLSNLQSPEALRGEVRRIAAGGDLRYLVLVGDADPQMHADQAVRRRSVPVHHAEAVVNVRFGSTKEIATDNWYADLDDDRVPDVAVGRLTCDSAEELGVMVGKILDYEESADYGTWRRQVNIVAGLGGFGAVADALLAAAAKSLLTEGIPAAYTTTMTYGSWQSPYCPDPRDFRRVTLARLNEGSLFWVYIGHGQPWSVDEVRVPGGTFPILSTSDTAELACRHGAPIACFLACYSGAFDLPRDCLAEEMLRASGGPVAILCGSRVTMPYAMSVMGSELLEQCFGGEAETLGEAVLAAKRRMTNCEKPGKHRAALDAAAAALSPTAGQLAEERAEHLDLFNLLGDPLLRVTYPRAIDVRAASSAQAGGKIRLVLSSPVAGGGVVELAVRRDRLTFRPPRRGEFDLGKLAEYGEVYRRANEPRLAWRRIELAEGSQATELEVPSEARGACHVRVFVEGPSGCAAGAADVTIEPAAAAAR